MSIEKNKIVSIGGKNYNMVLFSPSRSIKLAVRLSKLLGEPFAVLASKGAADPLAALPQAIKMLLDRMDENQAWDLIKSLMESVSIQGNMIEIDNEFDGRVGDLLKLVGEVIGFQFKDFMDALPELTQGAMKKAVQ